MSASNNNIPSYFFFFILFHQPFGIIETHQLNNKFPPNFKFGVSTAAYQIEGGWKTDGKGENIWDRLTHTNPQLITDHSNGDVACDSYHLWRKDVEILKEMGVDHYRFSLSWARILPQGFSNHINRKGIDYYNNLIDALLSNGITPMVTLYHWDLPQPLQDLGGWTNPQIIPYFVDFAKIAFNSFADRVKFWITINEPASICVDIYEYDVAAPHLNKTPGIGLYLCGKTILLAHAEVYNLYSTQYKNKYNGKVGITINSPWAEPFSNTSADIEASERKMQLMLGWWAHPIFSKIGDYPLIMKARISNLSKKENFLESRLPSFTSREITLIQGSADFLGLNNYHTLITKDHEFPEDDPPSYEKDQGTAETSQIAAFGFRKLLNWVKKEYDNPMVIITENGLGTNGGLDDGDRVEFLQDFLQALLDAILQDTCNVQGYTVWSIMDNMEWRSGYTVKFGLYEVNFTDPSRKRTPKKSAEFYKKVIKTHQLTFQEENQKQQ